MKRTTFLRRSSLKRTGRLRPMSAKRQRQSRTYSKLRSDFLKAHPFCQATTKILFIGHTLPGVGKSLPRSTEIHHMAGRSGGNYLNTHTWLAVCRQAHNWIHNHPKQARELGMILENTQLSNSDPS